MNKEVFDNVFETQVSKCRDILVEKAIQYASDADRLHNFHSASGLTGETPEKALAGMMLKHTVSVYDMCNSEEDFDMDLWDEKITDHLNYLFLLKGLVVEKKMEQAKHCCKCESVNA